MTQPTPLHDRAAKAGAVFADEAGFTMPARFGDPHAECAAARQAAVVFDVSHRGQVELSGPDAAALLHNLCTNDIKNLPAGHGCEFFLATNKARFVAQGIAHRLLPAAPPVLSLDLAPGSAAKVVAHLDHYVVSEQVEIADRTGSVAQLHLCGPQAPRILDAACHLAETPLSPGGKGAGGEARNPKQLTALPLTPNPSPRRGEGRSMWDGLRIVRHDWLGLPGYDLVCRTGEAANLWDRLVRAGAACAGLEAFNILRIEAGVPVDGIDIDADRFVVEVGRTPQAISYTKGCYLGQEPIVMARDRGHLNRTLLGLKVDASEPLPPGTKVMQNGQEVGQVTSSVWSPLVGSVIALAYLKRGSQEPGTAVEVANRPAVVAALPFTSAS